MEEKDHIKKCISQIESNLGWGDSDHWHNDAFNELSVLIEESTGILLSITTLKRLWGRIDYTSQPSTTTLNTLVQYLGYDHWRQFKQNQGGQKRPKIEHTSKSSGTMSLRSVVILASILALLFISFYSMVGPLNQADMGDPTSIHFSSQPLATGLPNSVLFDFDLKGVNSDDILIQQYWDKTKTIKINANQKKATGIYYYPGYFRAKLVVDGKIIKEHDLFIESGGWMATIDYDPVPSYLNEDQILVNGTLALPQRLMEKGIASAEPINLTYHFVDDLVSISGDDFTLHASLRHEFLDKWAVCQNTRFIILGSKGALIIPFSIPGCTSDLQVYLSGQSISGKQADLSALGTDFSTFREVSIKAINGLINVYVDDKMVYKVDWNGSIGRVIGLRVKNTGIVTLKDVKLLNGDGQILMSTGHFPL